MAREGPDGPRSADDLIAYLSAGGPTAVALSGGVDSTVVAHLLQRALGRGAFAVTLQGPAVSPREVERATSIARRIGIAHATVPVDPLAVADYRANPSNRCYFCRRTETGAIKAWGSSLGVRRFVDGVHLDDLGDDRPGLRAMEEAGFVHPLVWAGWRKASVREYARSVGLPNWDLPSDACLASRVRHGELLTPDLLDRVRRAEELLLDRGFVRVRVRTDGRSARVEVDPSEVARLLAEPQASEVRRAVESVGFDPVELDPLGYRPRAGA